MPLIYYRLFFFCLMPVGLFVLIQGICLMRRSFAGKVLLDAPFSTPGGLFSITTPGVYAIWATGPLFRRNPLDRLRPLVFNTATQQPVSLNHSLLSPRSAGGSRGSMELFTFHGEPGAYRLEIVEGSAISGLQRLAAKALPATPIDLAKFSLQIRQSQSQFVTFLAIPIMLAGSFLMLGGLVSGLLADQFF